MPKQEVLPYQVSTDPEVSQAGIEVRTGRKWRAPVTVDQPEPLLCQKVLVESVKTFDKTLFKSGPKMIQKSLKNDSREAIGLWSPSCPHLVYSSFLMHHLTVQSFFPLLAKLRKPLQKLPSGLHAQASQLQEIEEERVSMSFDRRTRIQGSSGQEARPDQSLLHFFLWKRAQCQLNC